MNRYKENIMLGCFILFLSIVMYVLATTQTQKVDLQGLGPSTVPHFLSFIVGLLSLVLIGKGVCEYLKDKGTKNFEITETKFNKFAFIFFVIIIVYATVMNYLGYFIASCIILSSILFFLGEREKKNYIILNLLIVIVYLIINVALNIKLPQIALF